MPLTAYMSPISCRLGFLCFLDIYLHPFSTQHGWFSFGKKRPLAMRLYSRLYILRSGVCLLARKIRLAMTVVVGNHNFCCLDQGIIVFITWIKFFIRKIFFILYSSYHKWLQHFLAICGRQNFRNLYPQAQPKVHSGGTKRNETLLNFLTTHF